MLKHQNFQKLEFNLFSHSFFSNGNSVNNKNLCCENCLWPEKKNKPFSLNFFMLFQWKEHLHFQVRNISLLLLRVPASIVQVRGRSLHLYRRIVSESTISNFEFSRKFGKPGINPPAQFRWIRDFMTRFSTVKWKILAVKGTLWLKLNANPHIFGYSNEDGLSNKKKKNPCKSTLFSHYKQEDSCILPASYFFQFTILFPVWN